MHQALVLSPTQLLPISLTKSCKQILEEAHAWGKSVAFLQTQLTAIVCLKTYAVSLKQGLHNLA